MSQENIDKELQELMRIESDKWTVFINIKKDLSVYSALESLGDVMVINDNELALKTDTSIKYMDIFHQLSVYGCDSALFFIKPFQSIKELISLNKKRDFFIESTVGTASETPENSITNIVFSNEEYAVLTNELLGLRSKCKDMSNAERVEYFEKYIKENNIKPNK